MLDAVEHWKENSWDYKLSWLAISQWKVLLIRSFSLIIYTRRITVQRFIEICISKYQNNCANLWSLVLPFLTLYLIVKGEIIDICRLKVYKKDRGKLYQIQFFHNKSTTSGFICNFIWDKNTFTTVAECNIHLFVFSLLNTDGGFRLFILMIVI